MITIVYYHCNSDSVIPSAFAIELRTVIEEYKKTLGPYTISDFKKYLVPAVHRKGWSNEYYLDRTSKITITSIKEKTGLCIQTGNMARMYADLLKLQSLYSKGTITGGVLIIATASCGRSFGGNVASYERVTRELAIFDKVITMPLLIIGFDNEI
ncbi:MAG: hypothetical protein K6G89_07920 [Clostridia bacterium]|nr:hypothetical protein [Clostridia bacterium]